MKSKYRPLNRYETPATIYPINQASQLSGTIQERIEKFNIQQDARRNAGKNFRRSIYSF